MRDENRRLMLVCPQSRRLVDTGVRLEPEALRGYEPRNGRSFCPHCSREHAWRKEWLVLEVRPEEPA